MNEHNHGPSAVGSVVLNLGGDIGALIIQAEADLLGVEIEISPLDGTGEPHRTHSMVRERQTVPQPRYDAVYPDVQAGRYTIWRDATTPAGTVTISGGQITTYKLTA
ncbi:hypothetical protein ABIA35_006892 [Catenulispora sp. MAP12-49]|jgi:hypothetical protein|uniref:phospholipase n=1 Tax=unclassified Catenulispora TaxID=414885 RepID=UPI00351782E4